MQTGFGLLVTPSVALLAEGVDRNVIGDGLVLRVLESPSSRRAWIEMRW